MKRDVESLVESMAKGNYPEKVITTPVGNFKVKYLTAKEYGLIERRKAVQLNGLPRHSFDDEALAVIHRDCTLSVAISEYPVDFNDKWKSENFDEYPLEEVKNSLLREFNIFFKDTQRELSAKS